MDIGTILGLISGWGLIAWAIKMGGPFSLFVDVPSLIIVVGGTVTTMFMRFKMADVFLLIAVLSKAFVVTHARPNEVILQLVDMANIARKDGILALEKIKSEDQFLQSAINICVDGADPEFLENVLTKDLDYLAERHNSANALLAHIAEIGPAMGMLGTLVGLVQMLASMSDPSAIGPAMAVAILTSFYGSFLANMFAIPLGTKLTRYSKEEQVNRQLIIDGMIGIQKGVNPRMLQEALKAALPPKEREAVG